MLVLKIKNGQRVFINGGEIEVMVCETDRGWAKIGVTAPMSVTVMRAELLPEGPSRCCHCGGQLPHPGPDGVRPAASDDCRGELDPVSGRCRAFLEPTACGDLPLSPARSDGAA